MLEGVLVVTSLCYPLQNLEVVATVLGPNTVRYFFHRVVGVEDMVHEFEVFNFFGSQSRGLKGRSIKGFRAIFGMALAAAVLGLLISEVIYSGAVG